MLGIKADLRNWPVRVAAINEGALGIEALEIHLIPGDYKDRREFKRIVRTIGSSLRKIEVLSLHYPWQFTESPERFKDHWGDLTFTIWQLDVLSQMVAPQQATMGVHYQNERSYQEVQASEMAELLERKQRALKGTDQTLLGILERISKIARRYSQTVLLENNPTIGANVLGLSDQVAEDFIAYTTLWKSWEVDVVVDIAHAAMVQHYYQEFAKPGSGPLKNLEAIRAFYGGVPKSVAGDWDFSPWFDLLGSEVRAVHISGCDGWEKDCEGVVDLNDPRNLINVSATLNNVPAGVPVFLERRDSWKDWEGDLRNLEVLRAAA